jgi:SAM-dependent methyltransferase
MSQVLDVCCGSRMFWFDRTDARAVFMDNRSEAHRLKDKSSNGGYRHLEVRPQIIGDFTALPFLDESFYMVVFDPPHLIRAGANGWQAKKYGKLPKDWQDVIRRGFIECFRVLRAGGTLIFKWNEHEVPVSRILALTSERPLIGQQCGKSAKTHWLVFMKNPA